MAKIGKIIAREILDSRSRPTIEATVILSDGISHSASAPSGVLRGTYEASELRDGDMNRFHGEGVLKAIENIESIISPALSGMDVTHQQDIDRKMMELDSTQNKSNLGSNTLISVSQAVCKAAAKSSLLPLSLYIKQFLTSPVEGYKIPVPLFNMIEGGKHANNNIDFQEFLVIPATSYDYRTSLQMGIKIYHTLREYLRNSNLPTGIFDNAGFGPDFSTNVDILKVLKSTIDRAQYSFSKDVFLGIDAAMNTRMNNKKYTLKDRSGQIGSADLISFYKSIISDYSLIYLEDPFAEDDWEAWKRMSADSEHHTLIVGDDLTSTNPYRLQMALNNNVIDGIVIKPNQIGTITEALAVGEIARYKNLKIIVSSRSGETEDTFIADFAVAIGANYVKFGSPAHERTIKYNRLLEIERELSTFRT